MIQISNLNFAYNEKKVLKDLFLDIKDNEKISIIGKSGCGKTTLLKVIMGINNEYSGSVKVNGQEVDGINPNMSIVFQKNGLFDFMTIEENLLLTKKNKQSILKILKDLNIEQHINKYPKDLSGGQLQKANIARSLLMEKEFILLDEPTSSLDEFAKEEFQKQVMNLLLNNNFGYMLVTHDIKEALILSQRIILIEDGKIKKEFNSPYYSLVDSYLKQDFNDFYLKIKKEFYA